MNKKSRELNKQMSKALTESHQRMLDNALNQRVEVTDPVKLREMYPDFTDKQITSMARLNHKINVANDFLIEEQYFWLNPSERPVEGIEYDEELWSTTSYDEDKELAIIREEQKGLDDE